MSEEGIDPLDSTALRRRVLLTGLLTLVAFVAIGMVLTGLGAPSLLMIPGMVLVWALVVRPLMRPVRDAHRMQRDIAHAVYRRSREASDEGHRG